ncbi:alpha/beta fold hydrolase BchO [Roseibium sp. FZY0029]|uniref:alpha/beta fold hydrolase BchO n=1 Tax=Roseibium sp. FZY0029 TaxID=3116647 RepID=UPI002EB91FC1|nr:alpha/beta fold hydrolase BchO [Roseibium sp. FZY0029]
MSSGGAWLDWETDGRTWPHRAASRFVECGGYRWHVQVLGPENAPAFLLLHGTGAASFSWRTLVPLLADRFCLVVPDLPCHGFTRPLGVSDLSLDGMALAVRGLLRHLKITPQLVIGHSAGAVIGLSLVASVRSEPATTPQMVFSVNGALKPIRGNRLLSPMAKALFANPLSASMFSILARSTPLGDNLLAATGSRIDPEGEAIYRLLLGSSGHVRGALGMMASWDLEKLPALLRRLPVPLALLAARDDPMVPAKSSETAATLCRNADLTFSDSGGHLLHECDPDRVRVWIEESLNNQRTNGVNAA